MQNLTPILFVDGYKTGHVFQYPKNTELVHSNMTPRSSRIKAMNSVVFFGMQYFIKEYLIKQFNENFFNLPKEKVLRAYKRRMDNYLGKDSLSIDHIADLHDLGYLPLEIYAVPEGSLVPIRVPCWVIHNSDRRFFWLTNMLETLASNVLWGPSTSATTALQYLKKFNEFADKTVGNRDFVQWQGHDFSFRGMMGIEAALMSGAAHLLSFTGTDTIPAIDFLEEYYNADCEKELIGGSVPATEHSVQCAGGKENELETFKRLITEVYPNGIVSVVSDTWDFWQVITEFLPKLKDIILGRNGKLVIRPDSGDPVKIICGDPNAVQNTPEYKGAIECMWETFGGTVTEKGYKLLDSHIGLIYGDSITLERQDAILHQLASKGFASYNVVLGIGSYTYQYVTRDTYGWAIKATYCEREGKPYPIFKQPKTDSGMKNSAKGLLTVKNIDGKLTLKEGIGWEEFYEGRNALQKVFFNGKLYNETSLNDIRDRVKNQLRKE